MKAFRLILNSLADSRLQYRVERQKLKKDIQGKSIDLT